ncbi:MAG TPA: hypothetical protein VF435_10720, partial [Pyrinomonadaceae bacterium]
AVRHKLTNEIAGAVINNRIPNLGAPKRQVAELLQEAVMDAYRREILLQAANQNGHYQFDGEVKIEIPNRPDLNVCLELPKNARSTITLAELDSDMRRIAEEVSPDSAKSIELKNATTSSGREVCCELPLLLQLEGDRILRLIFAPHNEATGELPA